MSDKTVLSVEIPEKFEESSIVQMFEDERIVPIEIKRLDEKHDNFLKCFHREECKILKEKIDHGEGTEIASMGNCYFCPHNDKWIFEATSIDGVGIRMEITNEELADKVEELKDAYREKDHELIEKED